MSAMSRALDKIEAKAKKVAAHVMEASENDIEFKDGTFSVKGTDKKMAFGEVALAAYVAHKFPTSEVEPGLKEGAFYDPTNFTFPAGTHVCELEVDIDTGVVEIIDWIAVDDFGQVINPMIVEGQVHGGITQGVGQALTEVACLRRLRPAADRLVHGLHHAARRHGAVVQAGLHQDREPVQSAGHQGLW
jgi:carbon-monoxide dehydrogenase large subunit